MGILESCNNKRKVLIANIKKSKDKKVVGLKRKARQKMLILSTDKNTEVPKNELKNPIYVTKKK